MKILIIVNSLTTGGAEKFSFELASELANNKKYKVYLLSLDSQNDINRVSNFEIIKTNHIINSFYSIYDYFRVVLLVRKINPDIIHSNMSYADWFSGIYKLIFKKQVIISTIHSFFKYHNPEISIKNKIFYKILNFHFKRFNRIVCVSSFLQNYILENFKLSEKILKVIPNGVSNIHNFPIVKKDKLFTGKLVFVGSLREVKNVKVIIRILQELPDSYTLTIFGSGEQENEIIDLIKSLNLIDRVQLKGYKKNVIELLPNFDIILVPSFLESFSITALEGLLVGVPTLATKNGGTIDFFKGGLSELLIDPNDKLNIKNSILKVAGRYEYYLDMIYSYRTELTHYSIENVANEYIDLYKNEIDNKYQLL